MKRCQIKILQNERGVLNFGESLALKAVSLLLALILWITILGFKEEQLKKVVKFEPLVAPGMIITNKIPDTIEYTLVGPRVQLRDFANKLQPVRPDYRDRRDTIVPLKIDENILGELPSGVTVVSISPANLQIRLEKIIERAVLVRPSIQGEPLEGFEISSQLVAPQKVVISGPKSLVEAMEYVDTEPISVDQISDNMQGVYSIEIDESQGFRLLRDRVVRVELKVKKTPKGRKF